MKHVFFLIFVFIFSSLVACNNGSEQDPSSNKGEENKSSQTEITEKGNSGLEANSEEDVEGGLEEQSVEVEYKIENQATVIPIKEDINKDVVLLTIDDAPDQYTLDMAKTLDNLGVGAIFFVNGHFIEGEQGQEVLREIHDMGFVIGNHTYSHPYLPDLSEEEQAEEIVKLNDRIEEIIGERPSFFRAPNGANTDHSSNVAAEEGMVVMNWTYGYDYFEPYMNAEKLTEAMISGEGPEVDVPYSLLKPGANLLMHDRQWTSEALEDIVIGLRNQGYEIVDPKLIQTLD